MNYRQKRYCRSEGIAIPAALIMILLITSIMSILSRMASYNLRKTELEQATDDTYLAAEGAVNKQISELSVLNTLWSQKPNLSSTPSGYSQYSPIAYSSTNGIPNCSGIACHRNLYPIGGGLIKNLGPVNGDGDMVDVYYGVTEQLDPDSPHDEDFILSELKAWTQVERLDESTPSANTVGGSLSNSLAEGGNARAVKFRITGISTKNLKGRSGYSTVVTVVEMNIT